MPLRNIKKKKFKIYGYWDIVNKLISMQTYKYIKDK